MMSYLSWKNRGLSAVFAVIATAGFVSNADAIISRKVWDPAYGAGLPNLGWSGEVAFDIKDDCLDSLSGAQWITNLTTGCVGKLGIKEAKVTLYDLNNSSNQKLLSYSPSWNIFSGGNAEVTWRMYVDADKTLKAVQGGFLFPEFASESFAKVTGYDAAAFWLNFNGNQTNDLSLAALNSSDPPAGDFAFLTSCSYRTGAKPGSTETYDHYKSTHLDVACSQNDGIKYPAVLRPVPEPETYLLGLASFGVLGFWARRRRLNPR